MISRNFSRVRRRAIPEFSRERFAALRAAPFFGRKMLTILSCKIGRSSQSTQSDCRPSAGANLQLSPGLKADWPRVFAHAAEISKAVEIDCYPDRQDLNLSLLKIAREEGVRISLGTDAHHPWQLEFVELGLAAPIKAKIPAARIVNFMPLEQLKRWVARVRARA